MIVALRAFPAVRIIAPVDTLALDPFPGAELPAMRRLATVSLLVLTAVLLSACGGSSEESSDASEAVKPGESQDKLDRLKASQQ